MARKGSNSTQHAVPTPIDITISLSESDDGFSSDSDSDSDWCGSRDPPSHAYQLRCLAPARVISASGIACIVWGRDALEFAHQIGPSHICCHVLVDDDCLSKAGILLVLKLGYIYATPAHKHLEHEFPGSIHLEHPVSINPYVGELPRLVLLTPMSYYHVQNSWCTDLSRTLSLPFPVENSSLRFPTVFAFLDALVATYLEPRHGRDWALEGGLMVDISRLLECGLAKKDRSAEGRVSEAGEVMISGVRRENRLFLRRMLVRCQKGTWLDLQKERRMVLSRQYEVRGCSCGRCLP